MAGFRFIVQVEIDQRRAAIGTDNFPMSQWLICDVYDGIERVIKAYRQSTSRRLDLLVATPPCQGMSSSNPSRGKRLTPKAKALEDKNQLLLEVIPVAHALRPRIIVIENVRQVLTLPVERNSQKGLTIDFLRKGLPEYEIFPNVINVADYGIPQVRRRALVIAVHKGEMWLERVQSDDGIPIPPPTHAERTTNGLSRWISIREWFEFMEYERLDAVSKEAARGVHPLHFVPFYKSERYRQISDIPAYSGQSAYENENCPSCGILEVPTDLIQCPQCGNTMYNRPYIDRNGHPSFIKGFRSSYRRMNPDRPAYTITTNSSHIGSDFKIHPWQNRVLSILECADLQTVPRFYNWSRAIENKNPYLVRTLVGEAFPTYFTYLHGIFLNQIMSGVELKSRVA